MAKKNNGDSLELNGVPAGTTLRITGSKEGFEAGFTSQQVRGSIVEASLQLAKQTENIIAKMRLVDSKTGTAVPNAQVTFKWGLDNVRQATSDQNGFVSMPSVPANEEITVEVIADNYEPAMQTMRFANSNDVPAFSLEPKRTASFGSGNLIIKTFDKTTKEALSDVLIEISNPQTEQGLALATTTNGQFALDLPMGTIYKIKAGKAGYATFVSQEQTLRENPTQVNIELLQGGNQFHVNVVEKDSNIAVFDATVRVYSGQGQLLDEKKTPFIGSVDFTGLSADKNYYITGSKDGYVPQTLFVSPFETSEVTLVLESADASNTGTLNILVTDSTGFPGNNAGLEFFELVVGKPIPLGLPNKITESDGFASIEQAPANRNLYVVARKGLEMGDGNIFIQAGTENNLAIKMKPVATAKTLIVLDVEGNPFTNGNALLESVTGEVLFDGNLSEEGTTQFDAKNYKAVNITVTDRDGNSFSEQVNVEGKREITVQWPPMNSTELAPPIEFLGIEDSEGKPVEGITPNADYWLKFRVDWVKGEYRGGVHIRVGNDQTKFSDSEEVGITGFDASNIASFFYSLSYSAFPAPGNEAADFGNAGKAGSFNKWLELYSNNPSGSQAFRVKIKLKEGFSQLTIPIHYRSWAKLNGKFFRNPEDPELGTEYFVSTKTSLYAKTFDQDVSLFSEKQQCEQNVCAEYRFLSEDGEVFSKDDFKALRGKKYALEINLRAKEKTDLTLRASTDKKSPKVFFTGSEVETFTEFLDSTEPAPFVEVPSVSVLPNSLRSARLYFKPIKAGNASIKSEILGENLGITQDFYFNIFEQGEMLLSIEPTTVLLGQPFTVVIKDQNHDKAVTSATIHIMDEKGSIVASTVGNNSQGNGMNGRYSFSDSIGAGVYKIEATAFGFAPNQIELTISANNVLKLPEEISIVIPKGQASMEASAFIENASTLTLTDVTVEMKKPENWPSELDALIGAPSSLRAGQKGTMDITAQYAGDQNKRVSGTAELVAAATVSGKYPAVATSRLILSYNQPFDPNCLVFDQTALTVFLAANSPLGSEGQVYSPYGTGYGYGQAPSYSPLTQNQYYSNPQQYNSNYPQQFASGQDSSYYQQQPYSPNYNNSQFTPNSPYTGSGRIYSNTYSEYDQTAKEIELQVTNNCPQALQLTAQAIPKTGQLKDSGLNIEVSPFAIQPNETIKTTVRVSNQRNRALPQQETKEFNLQFKSNVVSKTLPLKVVLWDSRFALAVTNSVVLFLSQSKKGEPIVASSPLFMRNIGAEDIKNLEIEIGDSYLEGVGLRTIPDGRIPLLEKGRVVFPPKLVVAEKKGGTEKGRLVHSFLAITGEIDGKRYLLRTVDVWINVSAKDCLFLTPVDDLEFISPSQLVIDKKVKVRNTCEEPVRVVGIEPSQLGAVELHLIPIASDYLDRDREAEFILRLSRFGDYKNENVGISVAGLTQLTQKFISSNRLQAKMELGEKAARTGLASEPYSVNVCKETGASGTEKTSVRFPKITRNADCSKGYCDAVQAAEFLAKKLDEKINQAQNVIGKSNNQLENFVGCVNTAEQKACTFTELGVPSESFDLFLQNDQLTIDLLQKQFGEKGPATLVNYGVSYCPGLECEIKSIAQTGFPNYLYVSNGFRGCGRYTVKLNGAAYVQQNQIRNEAFILAVNVKNRELTPECINAIENVMNFLPVDSGMTAESPFGSWLGLIEADSELQATGKAFAKELFGTEEGRVVLGSQSNNLRIQYGDVPNGLVKVELAPETTTDEPKTIIATINQALKVEGKNKEEVAKEAAQAIGALKKQQIQEGKGCIAADHSYFILGSAAKLGELVLGGPDLVNVLPHQTNCVDLNIASPIREGVKLKTNRDEVFQTNAGIAKIVFRQGKEGMEIPEGETVSLEFSEKEKKYLGSVALCIEGNEQFEFARTAKPLEVTAQSTADSLRQSNTKKIRYQICGIHPMDLVKKLSTLQPGDHYATVVWKGPPDTVPLSEVANTLGSSGQLKKDDPLLQGSGIDPGKQLSGKQLAKDKQIGAVLGFPIPGVGGEWNAKSYLPACFAVSALCNGIRTAGFLGWLWGPVLDCGFPAAWMIADHVGELKQAKEFISQKLGSVSKGILDKIEGFFPGNDAKKDELLEGATVGVSAHSLLKGLQYNNYLNPASGKAAADRLASDIADQVVEEQMKGRILPFGPQRELKKLISTELEKNIRKGVEEKIGGHKWIGGRSALKANAKTLEEITQKAVEETNLDSKILDFAIKNQSQLKSGSTLAGKSSSIDDLAAKKLAEDFATVKIEGITTGGKYGDLLTNIKFDDIAVKDAADNLQLDQTKAVMWDRYMDKVRGNKGWTKLTPQAQNEIRDAIKQEFQDVVGRIDSPPPNAQALEDAFEEAVGDSTRKLAELDLTATTNARKVANAMADSIESKSGKLLGEQKAVVIQRMQTALEGGSSTEGAIKQGLGVPEIDDVKQGLRNSFKNEIKDVTKDLLSGKESGKGIGGFRRVRNFFRGLVRGVVCAAAANYAGLWMAQESLQAPSQPKTDSVQVPGQPVLGKDGQPQRTADGIVKRDIVFENGATYKIRMTETKNANGTTTKYPEITKVTDPNGIPSNASFLNTDCEGKAAERGLEGTELKLEPIAGQASKSEEASYQLTAQKISQAASSQGIYNAIPDAFVVTALILEQKYSHPNACDPQHQWLNSPSNSDAVIQCAGLRMHQAVQVYPSSDIIAQQQRAEPHLPDRTALAGQYDLETSFILYYNVDHPGLAGIDQLKAKLPAGYLNDALATYQKWNSFKPVEKQK